jgi:3-oxoacyl-[acyl-carrier-protein] synthase III
MKPGRRELLKSFGFESVHLAGAKRNIDMAIAAAEQLLRESDVDPDEIGMILYAAAL